MAKTTFHPAKHVTYMRSLTLLQLLAYQSVLQEANLSTRPNKMVKGEEERQRIITHPVAVDVVDEHAPGASRMRKGSVSTAIDHHIAVNLVLRERGYEPGVDMDMTHNLGLLEDI